MGTNNKTLNVPNLRFPEFNAEWKSSRLDMLVESLSTNSLSWDALNKNKGKVKNIHYGLIHKGFETTIISSDNNHIPYINESIDTTKMNFIKSGDLVMVDTSEDKKDVAKAIELKLKNDDRMVSGLHTFLLRDKTDEFAFGFKSYHLKCKSSQIQLNRISTGTKVYSINKSNLKEITINYPTKAEQFKIVDLLNKIENKIQLQMKIIDNYESLIYILRKRLLSSVGGNFILLSTISKIYQPQTITKDQFDENGFYLVYGANGVIGRYNQYNHENSQVCISCRGESCGAVTFTGEKSWITGNSMVINFDNNTNISKKFMYYYFKNINFKNIISGSGQPQITKTPLQKMKIKLPIIEHQKYIVNILDCVNNYRNTLEISNDNLRSAKKYLLENLFI